MGRMDEIEALFERTPASRPLALALGRFVVVALVGFVLVWIAGLVVDVPSIAFGFVLLLAIGYGVLGYRKAAALGAE